MVADPQINAEETTFSKILRTNISLLGYFYFQENKLFV
jgi:hypothetical protein